METQTPLRALVLSGGGAKGAFEAGLVKTLIDECGERFDIVCGTSIGAINAAFVAQNDLAGLDRLWHRVASAGLVKPYPKVAAIERLLALLKRDRQRHGLARVLTRIRDGCAVLDTLLTLLPLSGLARMNGAIDPTGIMRLLHDNLDPARIECVLITTATDLTTRLPTAFHHFPIAYQAHEPLFSQREARAAAMRPETFMSALRASAAIPGAFAPVRVGDAETGSDFVDGGVANNTPIGQAIDAGATEITVIYLDVQHAQAEPIRSGSAASVLYGCYTVMQQRLLALDYAMALRTNIVAGGADGLDAGAASRDVEAKRRVKLRCFSPSEPLAVGVLDFSDQARLDACFEQGRSAARSISARTRFQV